MRVRRLMTRVAAVGLVLGASTGAAMPPAHALLCNKVPAQCQAILDELKKYPLVCESIPNSEDPDPYSWNEVALCDNPDAWLRNVVEGFVSSWCPDGRCDRLIQDTVQRVLACLSNGIRCET